MDKEKVKKYFSDRDTVYNWWDPHKSDKKAIYIRQEKIIKELFEKKNIKKILDLSAGKGRFAKILSFNRNYTCLDISQQMLDCIKKLNLNVALVKGDAENILLKQKFGGIICAEALVHYPHPKKALKEMKRLVDKKGIIVLTVDNRYCLGKLIRIFENLLMRLLKKKQKSIDNEMYHPYTNRQYREMFKQANLKVKKKINLSLLTTPIKLYSLNSYLITPKICEKFLFFDKILERIPLINKLSTYFIYILENEK